MFKKQLLILFIIFWSQHSSCYVDLLFGFLQDTLKIVRILYEIESTSESVSVFASMFNHDDNRDEEITDALRMMNDKLKNVKACKKDEGNFIELSIKQLPKDSYINSEKDKIVSFLLTTDRLWDALVSHADREGTEKMLHDLANETLSNIGMNLRYLQHILNLIPDPEVSPDEGLLLSIIKNSNKSRDILCNQGETSHHSAIRLFHLAILTEMKVYILLSFAMLFDYSKHGAREVQPEREFADQFNTSIHGLSKALKAVQLPYIRSCEPKVWQKDENFYEFEGYLQQTVYNLESCQRILNPFKRTRPHLCDGLSRGKMEESSIYDYCIKGSRDDKTKCSGVPQHCAELDICFEGIYGFHERIRRLREHRYGCIGRDGKIHETEMANFSLGDETWTLAVDGQSCTCQCSESRVKLMRQLINSNIYDNHIIVGLRVHKVKDYIYIQIAEGKLEAYGYISNFSWVDSTRRIRPQWGYNYSVFSGYKDEYILFVEDLQVEPGHALIGAQFSRLYRNGVIGFGITIIGMKFDYKTGKLRKRQRSRGRHNSHESDPPLEIPGKNPIYMKPYEPIHLNSKGNTHVYFRQSNMSHDYGQSTLPLFDGVPIMTDPLSPIGGVGLFYKGYTEYAGFLSLRLFPINYTHYLEAFEESNILSSLLKLNH